MRYQFPASLASLFLATIVLLGARVDARHLEENLQALQGHWQSVGEEVGGTRLTPEELRRMNKRLSVEDHAFVIERVVNNSLGTYRGRIILDPQATPRRFDWTGQGPDGGATTLLGIYELAGDRLRICYVQGGVGHPRPRDFTTAPKSGRIYVEFQRDAGTAQSPRVPIPSDRTGGSPTPPDNPPLVQRVLVLNYDPFIPAENGKRLHEVFRWNNPMRLAEQYKAAMEQSSRGALRFEIVEWRNLDEIYAQVDGYRYTPNEYAANRRNNTGWHDGGGVDYPRLLSEQRVGPLVDDGTIDEVWVFSDHYFGLAEASMAGPGAFFINGNVYPQFPTQRPFAFYGFNYERGVAEMMHNTSHRTEATLNRVYGGWNLEHPQSNWDKFSANDRQSNGAAGVGTCHWPANAESGYDYGNPRAVPSWADDFLDYPQLDGRTKPVSRRTWSPQGKDYHLDYMKWYFGHVPNAAGTNPDGRQNNWWKYMFDFENYDERGSPRPASARLLADPLFNLGEAGHDIFVIYSSPWQFDRSTFDDQDIAVQAPNGARLTVRLTAIHGHGTRQVVRYQVAAPQGTWQPADRGRYLVALRGDQVRDLRQNVLPQMLLGEFSLRSNEALELSVDRNTLLLLHGEENVAAATGPRPLEVVGVTATDGVLGQALAVDRVGHIHYPASQSLDPAAGTVEFWIRPSWNGRDAGSHVLFEAGDNFNNGIQLLVDGAHNLRWLQWGDDPATTAVERNVERGVGTSAAWWKAGQWRHVAVTWDTPQHRARLYVDGQLASASDKLVHIGQLSGKHWTIGAEVNGRFSADAAFDEIRLSSRARSASEIFADYQAAQRFVRLEIDGPSLTISPQERVPLRAVATDQLGRKLDVSRLVRWTVPAGIATVTPQEDGGAPAQDRLGLRVAELLGAQAGTGPLRAELGSLTASIPLTVDDSRRPTARLTRTAGTPVPGQEFRLEVTFNDREAIRVSSLGYGNIRVVGGDFSQFAELRGVDQPTDGPRRTATYAVTFPPTLRNGGYRIEVEGLQVASVRGHYVADQTIGIISVGRPAGTNRTSFVPSGFTGPCRSVTGFIAVPKELSPSSVRQTDGGDDAEPGTASTRRWRAMFQPAARPPGGPGRRAADWLPAPWSRIG
ncbi:MAG: LamG-like jellyroll fold domain-containing protein [Pirellulales bacterium]